MQWRLYGRLVATALLLCTVPAMAVADEGDEPPRLTVHGEAALEVPADQLRMEIGVVTDGPTAQAALDRNTAEMQRVVAALAAAGLSQSEYQTGQFQIQPQRAPRPRNPGPDWQPHIAGYTVTNRLSVKTTQIDRAGKLIGVASGAGDEGGVVDEKRFRHVGTRTLTAAVEPEFTERSKSSLWSASQPFN